MNAFCASENCDAFIVFRSVPSQENAPENSNQKRSSLKGSDQLLHVFADGGYAGDKLKRRLKKIGRWTVEIIKRSDKAKGFQVLPRRWLVERTFAWLGRHSRLAKDVKTSIASAEAWIMIAHIRVLTRRLERYRYY